jgi:hypothetical protein
MCCEFGVRISLGPLLKALQVEMLILERMRQLVGHDWLLSVEVDPISEVKLLHLRIVISRHLFGEQFY